MARQIEAEKYSTFVAMPFSDSFSYESLSIYDTLIRKAAEVANGKKEAIREFDIPFRADQASGQAVVITEEIVVNILEMHLFLADLTFQNAGVMLEAGIAFGLKPNSQIILISQGKEKDLHFDIRNNNVIFYRREDGVDQLAKAMIGAACHFEQHAQNYAYRVFESTSMSAIHCMKWYHEKRKSEPGLIMRDTHAKEIFPKTENIAEMLFLVAGQELFQKKLFRLNWAEKRVGMIPTPLGEKAIQHWVNREKEIPAASS